MDMRVDKISSLDFGTVHKIMTSSSLTDGQKAQFIKDNYSQIHSIVESKITSKDFSYMMQSRPLVVGRPLKNSFTKRGDKKLFAKTLGIEESEVDNYIANVDASIVADTGEGALTTLSTDYTDDEVEIVKGYVFRHGSKQQVVDFLDYELSNAKDILKSLYHTLNYESGGVADYFARPIHRMDNNTLVQMYNVVDKNLTKAKNNGQIDEVTRAENSEWAMARIYQIQNNQKLRNALKVYRNIS